MKKIIITILLLFSFTFVNALDSINDEYENDIFTDPKYSNYDFIYSNYEYSARYDDVNKKINLKEKIEVNNKNDIYIRTFPKKYKIVDNNGNEKEIVLESVVSNQNLTKSEDENNFYFKKSGNFIKDTFSYDLTFENVNDKYIFIPLVPSNMNAFIKKYEYSYAVLNGNDTEENSILRQSDKISDYTYGQSNALNDYDVSGNELYVLLNIKEILKKYRINNFWGFDKFKTPVFCFIPFLILIIVFINSLTSKMDINEALKVMDSYLYSKKHGNISNDRVFMSMLIYLSIKGYTKLIIKDGKSYIDKSSFNEDETIKQYNGFNIKNIDKMYNEIPLLNETTIKNKKRLIRQYTLKNLVPVYLMIMIYLFIFICFSTSTENMALFTCFAFSIGVFSVLSGYTHFINLNNKRFSRDIFIILIFTISIFTYVLYNVFGSFLIVLDGICFLLIIILTYFKISKFDKIEDNAYETIHKLIEEDNRELRKLLKKDDSYFYRLLPYVYEVNNYNDFINRSKINEIYEMHWLNTGVKITKDNYSSELDNFLNHFESENTNNYI